MNWNIQIQISAEDVFGLDRYSTIFQAKIMVILTFARIIDSKEGHSQQVN